MPETVDFQADLASLLASSHDIPQDACHIVMCFALRQSLI